MVEKKSKGKKAAALSRPDWPIHCIYFYYIKVTPAGPETRVYYRFDKTIPVTNIANEITTLTINAYNDMNNPPCLGSEMSDLDWRRKSYIVVMVEGHTLGNPPFRMQEDNHPNPNTFGRVTPARVEVTDGNGDPLTLTGGYVKNTMKHYARADDLEKNDPGESFRVILNPPIPSIVRYPDSGGTNMGPPVPPP